MSIHANDYRELIRFAFERRVKANPSYSLRAFARDLGLVPSRVSGVLNRKQGLSREKAVAISQKLGLSKDEEMVFCDLVESEHARSSEKKSLAKKRVKLQSNFLSYANISLDRFRFLSGWHHLAILETVNIQDFQPNAKWISERLGIHLSEAKAAIQRLVRYQLLEITPTGWKLPSRSHSTPTDVPSEAIRDFHRQILEKAKLALMLQTTEERDFSAMIMAVPSTRLREAKQDLKEFRRQLSAKYDSHGDCDEVYCLSSQFFKLTQTQKPDKAKS